MKRQITFFITLLHSFYVDIPGFWPSHLLPEFRWIITKFSFCMNWRNWNLAQIVEKNRKLLITVPKWGGYDAPTRNKISLNASYSAKNEPGFLIPPKHILYNLIGILVCKKFFWYPFIHFGEIRSCGLIPLFVLKLLSLGQRDSIHKDVGYFRFVT